MKDELMIKKCLKCGTLVKIVNDCDCEDCGIICCDEKMEVLKANSTDAAFEKHVPSYTLEDSMLKVKVNHVMEDDHFIEWICFKSDEREEYVYLNPGKDATAEFKNVKAGTLYAYCNKHGLWNIKIGE